MHKSLIPEEVNHSLAPKDESVLTDVVVDSNHFVEPLNVPKQSTSTEQSSSSWNTLFNLGDFESSPDTYYEGYESSAVNSSGEPPVDKSRPKYDVAKHQYQLSYEMALDNVLTPFADNGHAMESPLLFARRR